jgi:Fur family peroxide stress response transcriptional regulator
MLDGQHNGSCTEESIRALFRKCDLRYTRQRAMVYQALATTDRHPTAEEIFSSVGTVEPGLSLATVYNTLEVLSSSGLCRRLPCSAGTGACRYDADVSPHVHVMIESGAILDVPDDLSASLLANMDPGVLAELESRLGVRITSVDLRLGGTRRREGCE